MTTLTRQLNFFSLLLITALCAFDSGEKYLGKIGLYQKDSYFKKQVYEENDWRSFYKLPEANKAVSPDNYDLHLVNAAVFYATNKLREEKSLKPLKFSAGLRDAAVVHTYEMVYKNFFDHFNSQSPGLRSPDDRIKLFGLRPSAAGENIDMNNIPGTSKISYVQLADKMVTDFYNSPPHRKTMLSKAFSHLGCSAMFELRDRRGYRYFKVTQDFSAL